MVTQEENANDLSDRLSKLAQRLDVNEDMSAVNGPGPCRMAMHGASRAWTAADQQVRGLAGMQSLWPETPIHYEGRWDRRQPGHWTSTRPSRTRSTGAHGVLPLRRTRSRRRSSTANSSWRSEAALWWRRMAAAGRLFKSEPTKPCKRH